jgi:hypothetical protein
MLEEHPRDTTSDGWGWDVRMRELSAIVAAAALLVAAVSPATAETVERDDRRGDAPAGIDVVQATYSHTRHRVRVVARVPDLGPAGSATLSISRFEIFEAGYVLRIRARSGAPPRIRLLFFNHFDLEPRRCAGVTGTWANGVVRLSVARTCLVGHVAEQVFAQFHIRHGSDIDEAPAVRRLRRS